MPFYRVYIKCAADNFIAERLLKFYAYFNFPDGSVKLEFAERNIVARNMYFVLLISVQGNNINLALCANQFGLCRRAFPSSRDKIAEIRGRARVRLSVIPPRRTSSLSGLARPFNPFSISFSKRHPYLRKARVQKGRTPPPPVCKVRACKYLRGHVHTFQPFIDLLTRRHPTVLFRLRPLCLFFSFYRRYCVDIKRVSRAFA